MQPASLQWMSSPRLSRHRCWFRLRDRPLRLALALDAANEQGQPVTQVDRPISITVDLAGAVAAAVQTHDEVFGLAAYDPGTDTWETLPAVYDPNTGKLVGTTTHFSLFAVWSDQPRRTYMPALRK